MAMLSEIPSEVRLQGVTCLMQHQYLCSKRARKDRTMAYFPALLTACKSQSHFV